MKRFVAVLIAVVLGAGLTGCGGGGDAKEYSFGGDWLVTTAIVSQQCSWTVPSERLHVVQNGSNLLITQSGITYPATCDPEAGTLLWSYITEQGGMVTLQGAAVDDNTLAGTARATQGGCWVNYTWTAELIGR